MGYTLSTSATVHIADITKEYFLGHMEGLIAFLIVTVLVGSGVYAIRYYRQLRAAVDYSNEHGVDIFGARYRDIYHLISDVGFANSLWSSVKVQECEDEGLKAHLYTCHQMLRRQTYAGIAIFISLVAMGFGGVFQ